MNCTTGERRAQAGASCLHRTKRHNERKLAPRRHAPKITQSVVPNTAAACEYLSIPRKTPNINAAAGGFHSRSNNEVAEMNLGDQ